MLSCRRPPPHSTDLKGQAAASDPERRPIHMGFISTLDGQAGGPGGYSFQPSVCGCQHRQRRSKRRHSSPPCVCVLPKTLPLEAQPRSFSNTRTPPGPFAASSRSTEMNATDVTEAPFILMIMLHKFCLLPDKLHCLECLGYSPRYEEKKNTRLKGLKYRLQFC